MNRDTRDTREIYVPPSRLDIPDQILKRFHSNGETLRWIRFKIRNEEDLENMGDRAHEGYVPVRPEEVPELSRNTNRIDHSQYGSLVLKKDLVLMKIKIEKARARHEFYLDQARSMGRAMKQELMKHNDAKMPISHDVDEQTGIGRSVKFASDSTKGD